MNNLAPSSILALKVKAQVIGAFKNPVHLTEKLSGFVALAGSSPCQSKLIEASS